MDDTAFHYSRTLRIIMVLAIVIPIVVIGALLWYFTAVDVPQEPSDEGANATGSASTSSTPVSFSVAIPHAQDSRPTPLAC